MRVRGLVEYLGTKWSGWQFQPGQPTLQGEIERALSVVARSPVRIAAAGRTDSGVHASGQVIAFGFRDGADLYRLRRSINALTDDSITVVDFARTNDSFDPRRHAMSRSYEYTVENARPPSPFLLYRSWHVYPHLDERRLDRLAAFLIGDHDFRAFRAADCASTSTRRFVTESAWTRRGDVLKYRVSANAFLKQMVRTLVGSMVDVELGRLSEDRFLYLLTGGEGTARVAAGCTAPADGLSLVNVEYPAEFSQD